MESPRVRMQWGDKQEISFSKSPRSRVQCGDMQELSSSSQKSLIQSCEDMHELSFPKINKNRAQSCEDTQELSFSIRRILQDNRNDKTKTEQLTQNSEEKVIHAEGIETCRKIVHADGLLVFPWQVVNKQASRRIGHPYQSRATPKRKKPRTTFSRSQISELEELFTEKKYLTSSERQRVASYLQLTDCQVKTWFQNRRTKWKRETDEEKEEQRHALTRAMMSLHQGCL